MKQISAVTVDTSNSILALCNSVAANEPQTYRPIDPINGGHCDYIFVYIPEDATDADYRNLRWLMDNRRKGVVLKYQRMYLRTEMVFS